MTQPVYGAAPQYGEPPTHQMALWSMILGIVSIPCGCFPLGIAALIMGVVSRGQIDENPRAWSGRGFAVAGIWLGVAGLLCGTVGLALQFVPEFFVSDGLFNS